EVRGRFENAERDARRLLPVAIAAQAPGDERVVEGPHGAHVVADRVVATLALGHRAYAPSGEEPIAQQVASAGARLVLVGDATPQQMPDVRGQRIDLAFLAVERQREEAALGDPVVGVEAP